MQTLPVANRIDIVVDFRITTVGAALAAIVCGGGAVVIVPKTLEARPVLGHEVIFNRGLVCHLPSASLFVAGLSLADPIPDLPREKQTEPTNRVDSTSRSCLP